MLKDPVSITLGRSLKSAIQLMHERRVDTLLVTDDENHLKGYIDLESLALNPSNQHLTSVSDILITKIFKITTKTLIRNSADRILKQGLKYVPVVDNENRLCGIVTRSALVDMVYDIIWGDKNESENLSEQPPGAKLQGGV
ncbi:ABC-type proline glycine betaine transport system, ATPase component [Liquorilactobacillus oeni DSM 19972]|uniref:ABC-type proline glycine betaine transport system, ATPase component n=1 Tax=Liquorilactobacillus oeni DSM 19972 TaxID=1423777 RepID=A0A0R1MAY9_9LACO|nr:CBS domain-containing protein [Liquorilactobacillus oeni]KRL05049.1 ABC-type proline glycine betaine transport system, ATPase component [Liquorilactobacillus oeni DSM 19972]